MPDISVHTLFLTPSFEEWYRFGLIFAALFAFVGAAEYIRKKGHVSAEVNRKLVHISVGVLIFFTPSLFESGIPPMALAIIFIIVNFVAIQLGLFQGMHDTGRKTYGTVLYPLSFLILILLCWNLDAKIISISMLTLALADAAAAIVGESLHGPHEFRLTSDKKSVEGSATMFVVTFVVILIGLKFYFNHDAFTWGYTFIVSSSVAMTATAWEAMGSRGFDNLAVPLSVAFILNIYLYPQAPIIPVQMTFGIVMALLFAYGSHQLKFLNTSGTVAVFLLASVIFGLGEFKWTAPIITFFILSSMLSKYGKMKKKKLEEMFEKGDTRDWGQVAANGGIAGILMLAGYYFPIYDFFPVYVGTIAAVTADTWGTELGLLARGKTVSILTFKPVAPGTNGGISLLGMCGASVGALLVTLTSLFWNVTVFTIGLIVLGGVIGSLADSVLGASLQGQFRNPADNKLTEKRYRQRPDATYSGYLENEYVRGIHWLNNDVVNWCCAGVGALATWVMVMIVI
jgi:uncharacterized protein (TIGR00297 family)